MEALPKPVRHRHCKAPPPQVMPPSPHPPGAAPLPGRRRLLARALGWPLAGLAGCAAPWPEVPAGPGSSSALARLQESAAAHGLAAWRQVQDLNLGLRREPNSAVGAVGAADGQIGAADGSLQLRWLPAQRLLAWHDAGLPLPQHGWRRWAGPAPETPGVDQSELRLWQAGQEVSDPTRLLEAARQVDLLALLLLGPMALVDAPQPVNWAEPATLDGRRCDQLTLDRLPGLGGTGVSRLALFIDRELGLMRRLRVMSNAEQGQPGAMAATWDLPEPIQRQGVQWPRLCIRVAPPRALGQAPAGWRLVGLDLNRGYAPSAVSGAQFSAAAAASATALADRG